ncbi:exosortase family protein XrtF [Vitellibacter sp. q18]|nr:exosortase family protein XrtF [Aequorivita lutea]
MKQLLKKYKAVIRFVLLFLGAYLLLSTAYGAYLHYSLNGPFFPDFATNLVARQTAAVLEAFGYSCSLVPDPLTQGMLLTIENAYTVNVVEGCNSISVVILFISFVIAFAEKFKKTFLFLLSGAVLIYAINLIRIAILTVAMYKFPAYEHVLHGVIFPGIIYGFVFLLWMVWVRMVKPNSK